MAVDSRPPPIVPRRGRGRPAREGAGATTGRSRISTASNRLGRPGCGGSPRPFGSNVRFGTIVKNYVNPEVGRYAPPEIVNCDRRPPQGISNARTICTSNVERHNLSIRTFLKRFARLSLGFSKKLDNLAAAVALYVAFYDFCWRHGTLRVTPAMAAGVVGELWSLERLHAEVMG